MWWSWAGNCCYCLSSKSWESYCHIIIFLHNYFWLEITHCFGNISYVHGVNVSKFVEVGNDIILQSLKTYIHLSFHIIESSSLTYHLHSIFGIHLTIIELEIALLGQPFGQSALLSFTLIYCHLITHLKHFLYTCCFGTYIEESH